MHETFSS